MYKYLSVILDDTADFNQTAELYGVPLLRHHFHKFYFFSL